MVPRFLIFNYKILGYITPKKARKHYALLREDSVNKTRPRDDPDVGIIRQQILNAETNILKCLMEKVNSICGWGISAEMEKRNFKPNEKILEPKVQTVSEMNSFTGFISRLYTAEENNQ